MVCTSWRGALKISRVNKGNQTCQNIIKHKVNLSSYLIWPCWEQAAHVCLIFCCWAFLEISVKIMSVSFLTDGSFLQSGLTKAVKESKISLQQAEYEFLSFVRQQTPPGLCPLAGKMGSFLTIVIMSSLLQFPAGCWKAGWCTWQGCFGFLRRDLACKSKSASGERFSNGIIYSMGSLKQALHVVTAGSWKFFWALMIHCTVIIGKRNLTADSNCKNLNCKLNSIFPLNQVSNTNLPVVLLPGIALGTFTYGLGILPTWN